MAVMDCVQLNRGQTGGTVGYDINVVPVWRKGITGQGIVVSILDDGIDHTHPDLQRNYVRTRHVVVKKNSFPLFLQSHSNSPRYCLDLSVFVILCNICNFIKAPLVTLRST